MIQLEQTLDKMLEAMKEYKQQFLFSGDDVWRQMAFSYLRALQDNELISGTTFNDEQNKANKWHKFLKK